MKRMLELHAVVHEYIHRSSKERVGAYKNSLTRELSMDVRWEENLSWHTLGSFDDAIKKKRRALIISLLFSSDVDRDGTPTSTVRSEPTSSILSGWLQIGGGLITHNGICLLSIVWKIPEFGKEAIPATTEMALPYSLDFKMQTMDYNINRDQRLLLIRRHFRYIYLWLRKVKRKCVACCI